MYKIWVLDKELGLPTCFKLSIDMLRWINQVKRKYKRKYKILKVIKC